MHWLPPLAANLEPEIRRHNCEDQHVKREGAERIDPGLLGRVDRIENVHHVKVDRGGEKYYRRMNRARSQGEIAGPVVQLERIDVPMWPSTHRIVLRRHQQPEQDIECKKRYGNQCDIARNVYRIQWPLPRCVMPGTLTRRDTMRLRNARRHTSMESRGRPHNPTAQDRR